MVFYTFFVYLLPTECKHYTRIYYLESVLAIRNNLLKPPSQYSKVNPKLFYKPFQMTIEYHLVLLHSRVNGPVAGRKGSLFFPYSFTTNEVNRYIFLLAPINTWEERERKRAQGQKVFLIDDPEYLAYIWYDTLYTCLTGRFNDLMRCVQYCSSSLFSLTYILIFYLNVYTYASFTSAMQSNEQVKCQPIS